MANVEKFPWEKDQEQAPSSTVESFPWEEQGMSVAPEVSSMVEGAYEWMTGADREKDIPILDGGGYTPVGTQLTDDQRAKLKTLTLTTFDDKRLAAGAQAIVPESTVSNDQYGNVVMNMPNGESFYLNPKGMDFPTVEQATSAVVTGSGAQKVLGAIAQPLSRGFWGTVLVPALEGTVLELASSSVAQQPYDPTQPLMAAGGGLLFGAGQKTLSGLNSFLRGLRSQPSRFVDQSGKLTEDAVTVLKEAGINPDEVTAQLGRKINEQLKAGVPAEAAALESMQATLPTRIPLTRGEMTGQPRQQLFEDVAEKGGYGETAAGIMGGMRARQQQAVEQNIPQIQERLAQGAPVISRGEGAAQAQESLAAARTEAQERAGQMYKEARETPAWIVPEEAEGIMGGMRAGLKDYRPYSAPNTFKLLDELDAAMKEGRPVAELWDMRSAISANAAGGGTESGASSALLRAFDNAMLDQMDNAKLYGDPEAIAKWIDATKNYKDFKRTWDTKGILKTLTETETRDGATVLKVAPEDAANVLLGRTLASAGKTNLARDLLTLRKNLLPAEFNAIRQEFFLKLSDDLAKSGTGKMTGVSFNKKWVEYKKRNPEVIRALFNKDEVATINSIAALTARIGGSAKNASNTASSLMGAVQMLFSSLGAKSPAQAATQFWGLKKIREMTGAGRAAAATSYTPKPVPKDVGLAPKIGAPVGMSNEEEVRQQYEELMRLMP